MKLIKRIFYIIFGLLIASAVSLVGLILYSEYSGRSYGKVLGRKQRMPVSRKRNPGLPMTKTVIWQNCPVLPSL